MIKIMKEIDEKDVTGFLKECLDKINADLPAQYIVEQLIPDDSIATMRRVQITLDASMVEPALAEIGLKELYGEIVYYDAEKKLFEIGGYECKKLSARTISGLMMKIEREVRSWK